MNDKKFMRAAMIIDGAFAGVAAFYSIPAALFMMALLVYAAINIDNGRCSKLGEDGGAE